MYSPEPRPTVLCCGARVCSERELKVMCCVRYSPEPSEVRERRHKKSPPRFPEESLRLLGQVDPVLPDKFQATVCHKPHPALIESFGDCLEKPHVRGRKLDSLTPKLHQVFL